MIYNAHNYWFVLVSDVAGAALVPLPDKFIDDHKLPILPTERWFDDREEAVAALPELLNEEA
ncbi:MAG TPA: hypothetical protein VG222_03175 [Vicinamibacterales bacterium]|nr:hypothetical protein [Vicinamibacterales bacterium]